MYGVEDISAKGIYGTVTADKNFVKPTKAIWCSAPGDVEFVGGSQNDAQVLPGVPANQWVPLHAKEIKSSATTATIALALYHP